ncbi:MAG: hypothetical protein QF662_08910, partial [Phycisphaerae bacterium]|nr:hypothetical protein [Phycisphaerae bacterium]
MRRHHIYSIPILGYNADWNSPETFHWAHWDFKGVGRGYGWHGAPKPEDFARFAAETAKRYKGKVPMYEIWNEPMGGFWNEWAKTREQYVDILKASYKAIKDVDPEIQVLCGASLGTADLYRNIYPYKPQKYFDILNFHYYSAGEWTGMSMRRYAKMNGDGHKRIINTEDQFGYENFHGIAQLMIRSMAMGIDKLMYFAFGNLFAKDYAPKPSYVGFSTTTYVLEDAKFVGRIWLDHWQQYAFVFKKGGSDILVAWSEGPGAEYTFDVGAKKVTQVNIHGYENPVKTPEGTIKLKLGAEPTFIVGAKIKRAGLEPTTHCMPIYRWSIIGPFDENQAKSLDEKFGPQGAINLTQPMDGVSRKKVAWKKKLFEDYFFDMAPLV